MSRQKRPDLTSHASLLGEGFASKVQLLGSIVQDMHYPSVGRYKERLLAETIQQHIPDGFKVGTGFVLFPAECQEENRPPKGFDPLNMSEHVLSRECDIIVYDATSAPVIFRDSDFVIVRPEVVKAIVEVKGNLRERDIEKTLHDFLDFGRKWRATQLFYREHHQDTSPRPSLYLLAWDVAARTNGAPETNGTKFRKQVFQFYRDNLQISEYSGMPILSKGIIYNECEVEHSGWGDEVDGEYIVKDGWTTISGQFVRFGKDGIPIRRGDRTVASLLASIHYALGKNFNRFFSYVDETNLDHELPFEHEGFESWLEDGEHIRAINSDKPA